jgi:undecaprenol kinase
MIRIARKFGYALVGIREAYRHGDFKVQVFLGVLAVIAGFYFHINRIEFLFLILAISFVLVTEAINTAIEAICNKFHPETHPHIALIKDLAAGAVLMSSIVALIVGIVIFVPYLS